MMSSPSLSSTNRGLLSDFMDSSSNETSKSRKKYGSGAATVGGDQLVVKNDTSINGKSNGTGSTTESEIYIRADGKKVRRIKKTILNGSSSSSSSSSPTAVSATATNGSTGASSTTVDDTNDTTRTTTTTSEVYIRPDGKKVRRIVRTTSMKPPTTTTSTAVSSSSASGTDSSSTSKGGLGNFLGNDSPKKTFRGSATVVGNELTSSSSLSSSLGEIYIRPDGKKVRRIKKIITNNHPEDATQTITSSTANNNGHNSSSNNSIATTISNTSANSFSSPNLPTTTATTTTVSSNSTNDDTNTNNSTTTTISKSEVYINAEGKKVRRVIKQKNKSLPQSTSQNQQLQADNTDTISLSSSVASISTNTTPLSVSISTPKQELSKTPAAATTAVLSPKLGGYFDDVIAKSPKSKRSAVGSSLTVCDSNPATRTPLTSGTSTTATTQYSDVYINADGKKVRRVIKSKAFASDTTNTTATAAAISTRTTPLDVTSTKSNTIAEGEIYIRADGKKVRRVKKGSSNIHGTTMTSGSSASVAPTPSSLSEILLPPPPPPSREPMSPLEGFLVKHSPKKNHKATVLSGSATVAGEKVHLKIDGGEIYINAQGKKVRRVRKQRPATTIATTSDTSVSKTLLPSTPDLSTSPKAATLNDQRVTTSTTTPTTNTTTSTKTHLGVTELILSERAKGKADAAVIAATTNTEVDIAAELGAGAISSIALPSTMNATTGESNDTKESTTAPQHTKTNDASENDNNSTAGTESTPKQVTSTNATPTQQLQAMTETSEIYINAEGKKVRRVRRTLSNQSTTSTLSNPSTMDGNTNNNGGGSKSDTPTSSNSNNQSNSTPSATTPQLGDVYVRADGKKVRRVRRAQSSDGASGLGSFLQNSTPNGTTSKLHSGSATVVGDSKMDGEIIIRPDGKKVIRRTKSAGGISSSATSTTAAGDLSTLQQVGEVYRNADGRLVRRVKRTTPKSSDIGITSTAVADNNETKSNKVPLSTTATPLPTPTNKAPVAVGIQLSEEEEAIAKIYRKMKNMGIPEDAVRHKMTVTSVHPKIIAAVMGEEWNDPATTTNGTTDSPIQASSSAVELTTEEDAIAATYRKMQKMGLPNDAVRHKMIVNDVAPKIVAAVLGEEFKDKKSSANTTTDTVDLLAESAKSKLQSIQLTGGEEMIASVYRRLQKMGLSDDAVRHKMTTSNVHPKIIAAVLNEEWAEEKSNENNFVVSSESKIPTLTDDEENIATPFRKMKKIGLPNDSIRHKMIMSEVHPKVIAAVLEEEWADDTQVSITPATIESAATTSLSSEDEAILAPYKRMLKMGLPTDTVRHKMTLEQIDPSLIDKLLNKNQASEEMSDTSPSPAAPVGLTDEEEHIVAQYKKMRRMGLPDDAIRHKMIVNEVDPRIIAAFFIEQNAATSETTVDGVADAPDQPASANAVSSKLTGAVAYVVVIGDEDGNQNQVLSSPSDQSIISPEEKFAVKVVDETHPESKEKQTKFYTLDELARLSGQSKSELEAVVKDKRQRGLSPPKFTLQPLDEPKYEVSVPTPKGTEKPTSNTPSSGSKNVTAIREGQEVVDSDVAQAARAVSALGDGEISKLLEKLKMGDMKDLLEKLHEAEKRQKKLEKQLAQAGVAIAEDIDYQEALNKVEQIAKRMNEIGGSDVVVADKAEQNRLREEYFKLEQEMERYNTALVLSEEYQAEQDRLELKWEADNEPLNKEALRKIRRHMPVNIRNLSEADLTTKPSPNGKYLPVVIAKKFKRTNILQCLRLNPDDLECMHPATLENMRVTGLTLTERRALYIHFKPVGPKWEKNKAEKMTERKWTWYQMMRNNFKENVAPYQRHIDQYGGPEDHKCPLLGKQCPIRADKNPDYDGDYGWTEEAEYEVSDVRKADVEDSGAKAKAEALELMKAKKANERADLLKKHYKGKLLQVSKANGSCEGMDESMDQMENNTFRWTENMLEKGNNYTDSDKKKEVASFMDALNEFKLKLLAFAQRSGMQMSGKKTDGGDSTDIRSAVEGSLSEEVYETSKEYFAFIRMRLKKLDIVDTRAIKTIEMLEGILDDLHGRNLALFEALSAKRMTRSRKLKTNKDIQKDVEDKNKPKEEEVPAEEPSRPGPPMGGGGRGGLMDAIAGRGRGGGGRGGLLDAIAGRGRGGRGGGRGGLLDAIAGRGRGGDDGGGGGGGRGDLLSAIAGRGRGKGRGSGGGGGGRGDLLAAISGRGGGGADGGRGGLLAAIAARGGGGD